MFSKHFRERLWKDCLTEMTMVLMKQKAQSFIWNLAFLNLLFFSFLFMASWWMRISTWPLPNITVRCTQMTPWHKYSKILSHMSREQEANSLFSAILWRNDAPLKKLHWVSLCLLSRWQHSSWAGLFFCSKPGFYRHTVIEIYCLSINQWLSLF